MRGDYDGKLAEKGCKFGESFLIGADDLRMHTTAECFLKGLLDLSSVFQVATILSIKNDDLLIGVMEVCSGGRACGFRSQLDIVEQSCSSLFARVLGIVLFRMPPRVSLRVPNLFAGATVTGAKKAAANDPTRAACCRSN